MNNKWYVLAGVAIGMVICVIMLKVAVYRVKEESRRPCVEVEHDTKRQVTCWVDVCGYENSHSGIFCIPDAEWEPEDQEPYLSDDPTQTAESTQEYHPPLAHGWK